MIRKTVSAIGCALLLALVSASCASVNQKLNKENRAIFEAPPQSAEYPSDTAYAPRPWAPGQWATYAIRNEKIWMLQKISVVGEDENGFWLEMETHDPNSDKSPSWIKMQISGYDPGDPESIRNMQVGNMYMMQEAGGQVTNVVMPFGMGNPWEWVIESMRLSLQDGPPEDITVGAGSFAGCKRIDSTLEFFGFTSEGTAWFHSAVPIWGYSQQITKDGKYDSRLLKFGYEGAQSVVDHSAVAGG